MKKFLGFNPQQYGDLYMGTVAARYLKSLEPDGHLTFMIAGDYRECAPLFIDHPHIDRVHILDSPRDRLYQSDLDWIDEQHFILTFNPFSDHDHSRPWWKERRQTHEVAYMHRIPIIDDDNGKIHMAKWFKPTTGLGNHIAFAPFPGSYSAVIAPKTLSLETAQKIVDIIVSLGYKVLQIGSPSEPALIGADKRDTDYFTSVKNVLGCKCFVGGDSGFMWLMSGYNFPCLGLYSNGYYTPRFISAIQPINPNALYLDAPNVNEIELAKIEDGLKKLIK